MRKWYVDEEKIKNGDVEIYYTEIDCSHGECRVYNGDKLVAKFGAGERIVFVREL